MKRYITFWLLAVLSSPAFGQHSDNIDKLFDECRLVRGHAHMIQKMIDDGEYNYAVARAHFEMVKRNITFMEQSINELTTRLSGTERSRVAEELKTIDTICRETKTTLESLEEEINSEAANDHRIRVLAIRIQRSLKTAMDNLQTMKRKL